MGVPVISMYGDSRGQRFGYSMLMNAGLEDLTAETADEYTEKAILLGNNPEVAAELRRELRGMVEHSPLMDEKGYVRIVEEAFDTKFGMMIYFIVRDSMLDLGVNQWEW